MVAQPIGIKKAYPGYVSAQLYLKQQQAHKWHKAHKQAGVSNEECNKNIQFARELFLSWDTDQDGIIREDELVKPLVSLGLAPDHKFARKICLSLDPKEHTRGNEPVELHLEDFLRIFKSDKTSD